MAALTGQNRWVTGGIFVGVGLAAWLAAMGTARVIRAQLALPGDAELAALEVGVGAVADAGDDGEDAEGPALKRPTAMRRKPTKTAYVNPITRRNIFDSTAIGATASPPEEVTESGRRSDLKVVLLATLVAEPAEFSSALIAEEKGKDGAVGYGEGDNLLGEATIVRIEARKVIIRRDDGSIEYIAMEEGKGFEKDKGAASGKGKDEEDEESGVTKDGDKFVVDQALVDKILENPEALYTQIRAVPHKGPDGQVDGYRLSGIRRKSVFHQLGIKNGDIVHGVNGKSLNSMSAAMDAFNGLQNDKNFSFDITRRNNKKTFEYEIR
jgi:general secretion pathway protein C